MDSWIDGSLMDLWMLKEVGKLDGWMDARTVVDQLHSSREPTLGLHVCRHPATPWKGGRGEIAGIARKV